MDVIWEVLLATLIQGSLYAIVALGLLISFQIIRFPDLTCDGSFTVGGAAAANVMYQHGGPLLGLLAAVLAGSIAGLATGVLSVKLRISRILSGILIMTMLYTVSLRIMGRGNLTLVGMKTALSPLEQADASGALVAAALCITALLGYGGVSLLLRSDLGLLLRATGRNALMARATARNTDTLTLFGISMANGAVALGGALASQKYGFADINLGLGTLVSGLACLFVGGAMVRPRSPLGLLAAAFLGSLGYVLVRNIALRLGFEATDLKLITGMIVVVILTFGLVKKSPLNVDDPF